MRHPPSIELTQKTCMSINLVFIWFNISARIGYTIQGSIGVRDMVSLSGPRSISLSIRFIKLKCEVVWKK